MTRSAHDPAMVRTFALAGHRSSGKTSTGDLLLHATGVTRVPGRVDDGTSLLDHDPEARRRRLTLGLSFAWMEWKDRVFHLVDTPGSEGLGHDRALALAGADAMVLVVGGPDGLQVGGERALEEADRSAIPRLALINRMDRPVDVAARLAELEAVSVAKPVAVQLPIYADGRFCGVVDVLGRRALLYDAASPGTLATAPIPDDQRESADVAWERLVEAVALTDDALLERYMEDLELPVELVREGLARAVRGARLMPVAYASTALGIGAEPLLELIASTFPSPATRKRVRAVDVEGEDVDVDLEGGFVAQHLASCFDQDGKLYHVLRVWGGHPPRRGAWVHGETGAVARVQKLYQIRGPRAAQARYDGPGSIVATWDPLPGRPGDTWTDGPRLVVGSPARPAPMTSWLLSTRDVLPARLAAALAGLESVDAALEIGPCDLTGAPVLAGIDADHLDRAVTLLRDRFGVHVEASLPPIAYRETPSGAVHGVAGIHQRMSDGEVSEFGSCSVDLAPQSPADGNWFRDDSGDDQIPEKFRPSIGEGVRRGLLHGPLAGYPVIGAGVRCTTGDYDILQSTGDHFRLAGERAVHLALERAGTRLLEPWCTLEVRVPSGEIGLVIAEVAARRGRIHGLEMDGREARVVADCPQRELRSFAPRLQAITAGRGRFMSRHSHYDALPQPLVKEAVAASPFREIG